MDRAPEQAVQKACHLVHLKRLIRRINFHRLSSISFATVLKTILLQAKFASRSLYRVHRTPGFTKHTIYNILNDGRINWFKLTRSFVKGLLTNDGFILDQRKTPVFILDDTLLQRPHSKKTELVANGFDHDKHHYIWSFRDLVLAISDGDNVLPIADALMSSEKKGNRIGAPPQTTDRRTNAGRRRV